MSLESESTSDSPPATSARPVDLSPFEIGDCQVMPEDSRVLRDGAGHQLEPMAMRLLLFLAARPAEVISRREILHEVWEGRAVVDETLSRAMSLVRQALGDSAQNPTFIETLPRRGYRLIAPVQRPSVDAAAAAPTAPPSAREPRLGHRPRPRRRPVQDWLVAAVLVLPIALVGLWLANQLGDLRSNPDGLDQAERVSGSRRPGIAVLPFENLSPAPENAYLAAGLTEELIHQLAGVSGLRVVSRASSMQFSDADTPAPEIGRALGVDYLLRGTVLAVEQRLRITAQLIRPDLDEHLLSRSYDRDFSEILALQREVAKDVVEQTRTELSPTEATRLTREHPIDSAAYRAFLRGQQVIQQRNELEGGLDLLERAVELDPGFAPAWAALADAHLLTNSYLGRPAVSVYAAAEAAIGRALELDPRLAPAHAAKGLLRLQRDRDWSAAEASYRRATELEPSYVTARQWYSELLSLVGRHDEALAQIGIALELDPLSPLIHAAAAQRLNAAGRHREALSRFQDAEALGADFRWILHEKAWAFGHLREDQQAVELLVASELARQAIDQQQIEALHRATRERGLAGYYQWSVETLLTKRRPRPGYPAWLAAAYAGTGQRQEAFEWLAKAAAEQNLWLPHALKNPAFNLLRSDPGFLEALGDVPPWQPAAAATGPNP